MYRVALIGCGEHAKLQHAPALQRLAMERNDMTLLATCDLNRAKAESVRESFGFRQAYDDLNQMLDQAKPNVCILVTSRPAPIARIMLEKGLPCVIEKPPGASLEEVRSLARLARQKNVPHLVSMNRRFNPHIRRAAQWASAQGMVRYIRVALMRHARVEPNHLWSTGLHAVDTACYLGGQVERYQTRRWHDGLSPEWYAIDIEFCHGLRGMVELLPTCGMQEEIYELFGNGFRARASVRGYSENNIECWRDNSQVKVDLPSAESVIERVGVLDETRHFFNALTSGVHPDPSLDDVLPSMAICHGASLEGAVPKGKIASVVHGAPSHV